MGAGGAAGFLQDSPEQCGYQAGHKHFRAQCFLCVGSQGSWEPAGFGSALSQGKGGMVLSIYEMLGQVMWEVAVEMRPIEPSLESSFRGFCCHSAFTLK